MLNGLAEYIFGSGKSQEPKQGTLSTQGSAPVPDSLSLAANGPPSPPPSLSSSPPDADDGEWILVKPEVESEEGGTEKSSRSSPILIPDYHVLERRADQSLLSDDISEVGEEISGERLGHYVPVGGASQKAVAELLIDDVASERAAEYWAKTRDPHRSQGRAANKRQNKTTQDNTKTRTRKDKRGKNVVRSSDRKAKSDF